MRAMMASANALRTLSAEGVRPALARGAPVEGRQAGAVRHPGRARHL